MEQPFLDRLTPDQRRHLRAGARRRRFAKGEAVFHEGDPADTLHIIDRGRVAVRAGTPRGDVATLSVHGAGDVVGELALITGRRRRSASLVALEPTETLSIDEATFAELRRSQPGMDDFLLDVLAAQVLRLTERLVEALFVPADTRVLRRLIDLSANYSDEADIEIPLTQEDVASLAGTSRATVNRVLREAQEAGAVRLARSRVVVTDLPWLRRKAGV